MQVPTGPSAGVSDAAPQPPRRAPDPGLLLVSWAAVATGIAGHHGDYRVWTFALVSAGLLAAFGACSGRLRVPVPAGLAAAAVCVALGPFMAGPADRHHGVWYAMSRIAAYPAAAAVLGTLRRPRLAPAALALIAATALLRILATPTPPIDVHYLLTDSTRGLIHGLDMYRQSWPGSHGLQHEYPYLPMTSVLLLPAWLLTHEVRVGLLAASVLAVLAARRLAGTSQAGGPLRSFGPLLLVGYPLFAYQQQQSWTEPLLLALLGGMLLAVRAGRPRWAVLCLALALASKQHIALLLPLAVWWPAFGWRRTLAAAGTAFALVLPWLLAGPREVWDDAVLLNLHYGVLRRGLDLPALAIRHGIVLGFAVTAFGVGLAYLVAVRLLPRSAAGFAAGGGLVLLALDVLNKQSFFNHYTLPMGLFVFALLASPDASAQCGRVVGQRGMLVDAAV